MADWPDLDELKQKLNVETADWDDHLDRLLNAAIAQVQIDVGEEVAEPTESLAAAAMMLAVLLGSTEGDQNVAGGRDIDVTTFATAALSPKYLRLLKGHRVRFGIA